MLGSVVGSSRIERAAVRRLPRVRQRLAWTDMNFEFMKRAGKYRLIAYRQWDTEMNNRRSFSVGILLGLMALCCFGLLAATAGIMFRHVPGQRPRSSVIAFPSGDHLNVEVSAARDERGFGLMDRVAPGRGMLFIYAHAGQHRIWMYRTHFPLDLVWLNHRQQIIDIAQGVPPCYNLIPYLCPQYGQAKTANYVLELPQGSVERRDLRIGMKLPMYGNVASLNKAACPEGSNPHR
jgi:uncharacterized membrane protein (UPF0127 family)